MGADRRASVIVLGTPISCQRAVVRYWWGVEVRGADDPTAEVRWMLVGGDELGGLPLVDPVNRPGIGGCQLPKDDSHGSTQEISR